MTNKNSEIKKKVETKHIPVLLNEVIEGLNLHKGDAVFDGTLGGGGYFGKLCEVVGPEGTAIAVDQDLGAIKRVEEKSDFRCQTHLINENFRNLDKVLISLNQKQVQGVVFDLGLSSDQFEISGRGFSFKKNEPLLMTFSEKPNEARFTARDIVNTWDEENIADILYGYGEEMFSRRVAKKIVEAREIKPINTTDDLVSVIESAFPVWYRKTRKTHFATKTFQALRITVNDEIESLKDGLQKGFHSLSEGGRMAVISFHSLEDRIVKNFMKEKQLANEGEIKTKKPITPTDEEIKNNPRSRSAKLRIIEKINNQ
ncbi:TPA: 16S rRNA (cytosine(1402)-N(4))-methyltransferase [Candidatus Campbellbacteria bacterium]|nr:MAG: S-adenosyl-methyltransferase MraW, 16S rRNA (cytosine1402-N4)-methyltransferase [Candidatus Campbellbacteria bacterium GW2011_OD1_34_28]KKP75022.1 MAG: ribosomal RNA small subunit methyltransferase H [Candidatus Campbellbacteria bacterium GW2011_GWD2_35_24]KKP75908.1 MAG: S-adenosyl-methyltransferase MraW [Candidatus Campbellbacteria bacterium GW2011_GWC2_35_28]KKP76844.1 MAG: ribosomal RNA small subunit methyltransferase H [Candidatus Campbellbacteria bacterium GW2011_GWC1_35_31]KKP787